MLTRVTSRVLSNRTCNLLPYSTLLVQTVPPSSSHARINYTSVRTISSTTKLYPEHIPTNPLQKAVLAVGAACIACIKRLIN